MKWHHLHGCFEFTPSSPPLLMGILNVTPDSFSDGSAYPTLQKAVDHASQMIDQGAHIIDVGGESTRPGADSVAPDEEIRRTREVIEKLHQKHPDTPISIDTTKAAVAAAAIEAGASIVNDVSAARWDPEMIKLIASKKVGYICMHALDKPQNMQKDPSYQNAPQEILDFLLERKTNLIDQGIEEERMIFDVGIGFGKTVEHNLQLIRHQDHWPWLKRPILWGLSRKSFIGKILDVEVDDRLIGGLSTHAYLLAHSKCPQVWRVHDVKEHHQLIKMWEILHHP